MHDPSDPDAEESRTHRSQPVSSHSTAWLPMDQLAADGVGEYLRFQREYAAIATDQFWQAARIQASQMALMQRLYASAVRTMIVGRTGREREPPATAEAEPERPEPVVRRTPQGELAFKQWRPQQLGIESPEHEDREREQREARLAELQQRTEQEKSTGTDEKRADESDEQPDPAAEML